MTADLMPPCGEPVETLGDTDSMPLDGLPVVGPMPSMWDDFTSAPVLTGVLYLIALVVGFGGSALGWFR